MDVVDIIEALHESVDDCPRCMVCDTQDDAIRAAMETALAEHEKQVRAKVAQEVCAGLQRLRENGETDMRQAIATADSIARGDA